MVQKLKIVLLGKENIGKTSLVTRLVNDEFLNHSDSTIGAAFKICRMTQGTREVELNIWDTAGQERFSHFLPLYLHHARAALVCFELPLTDQVEKYIQIIQESDPEILIVLVATKIDLYGIPLGDKIEMTHPIMENYANEKGVKLFYTSAKTGQGVIEVFSALVEILGEKELFYEPMLNLNPTQTLDKISQSRCCW